MIIWFAANIPSGSSGGVARSMHGLAEGLRTLGHQTVIITNSSVNCNGYLMFALALAARLLWNMVNPPDWIIARSTDGAGCALLVKALFLKTRIAVHNHGWEEYAFELEKRLPRGIVFPQTTWKARMVRFPLLRACLALSACCISGTISEIRWLKNKYPRYRQKFFFAPNGVNVVDKGFWIDRHDAPLNLLVIGGLTWKKNLSYSIDIFDEMARHVRELRLYVIGTGVEKDRILRRLHPGITVVPEVKPDEMPHWYRTCPFLLSSSRYEGGHSFALLEAMSYACVVIASAIPSSMEIIRNNENGMLISGVDVKNDAAAITELFKENKSLVTMRRCAFAAARRNRWERQAKRMERVLCLSR